jgi:hypothetical protein
MTLPEFKIIILMFSASTMAEQEEAYKRALHFLAG